MENRQKWLNELAQPLRDEGLTVTVEVRWGKPLHTMILQRIDELKPDLVLRDATSHGLLQRLFFNNTSWQLIRQCKAPCGWCVQVHGKVSVFVLPLTLYTAQIQLQHWITSWCNPLPTWLKP